MGGSEAHYGKRHGQTVQQVRERNRIEQACDRHGRSRDHESHRDAHRHVDPEDRVDHRRAQFARADDCRPRSHVSQQPGEARDDGGECHNPEVRWAEQARQDAEAHQLHKDPCNLRARQPARVVAYRCGAWCHDEVIHSGRPAPVTVCAGLFGGTGTDEDA
jgi:hypothetical protein